ncbi:hypothetical protein SAMN04489867_0215 [Pedococcus dokdonensis]|uniref:Uncharacterized protein n=1 Tax=Pedococcus dokdonensis TaxID=443156 RepID=A0A1H0L751_9MICO|nr:hypothetical protein [Pedococcus dokdonensis]SDO64057.1 hypothetical protein SAMN04489867_0215 [Pedococcus dokdonensis]
MTTSRHAVLRAALTGFGLGAAWGVLARAWMRMVSTEPEFSWSGSIAIVLVAAVFGTGVGVATAARRQRGRRRWLRLAILPGMVMFLGQGLPLLPALVVAGPLVGRRSRLAKAVAALAVVGPGVLFWWTERLDEVHMLSTPWHVRVGFLGGMPLISAALAWAGHLAWGPLPRPTAETEPETEPVSEPVSDSVGGFAGPRPQEAAQGLQS